MVSVSVTTVVMVAPVVVAIASAVIILTVTMWVPVATTLLSPGASVVRGLDDAAA